MTERLDMRQVHLDFHTSEYIDHIAEKFDAQAFVSTLKEAHVNSVTCFARCHHGWLYYPSKSHPELIHPHLTNQQLLPEQIAACHKAGIRVPIYTTVQWDSHAAKMHPEWLCVDESGHHINSQGVQEPHFYYSLCLNSGYRSFFMTHLLDMIAVIGPDQIDGFFLDILFKVDCCCPHCQKEMAQLAMDSRNKSERIRYSGLMLSQFKQEVSDLILSHVPDATIFYNSSHIGYAEKQDVDSYTHLELESLPSGGWGYDHFPITMRYARNLGKPIIGMTGKFHTYWGDFHSLKNQPALEFECLQMLALGAGCSIGDQLHPDGQLSRAAYRLIGDVYRVVEKIERALGGAVIPEVDIAVLTPEETWYAGSSDLRIHPSLIGANRLLQELNHQFDIIDSEMDFSKYKLILLPDVIQYSDRLAAKLQAYLAAGGSVVGSYQSLYDREQPVSDVFGLTFLGDGAYEREFIVPNDVIGKSLPREEFVMYLQGMAVGELSGTTLLHSVQSYFNREGETFCSHQHAPSARRIGSPAVTQFGRSVYLSHPVFQIYRQKAPLWIKEVVKDVLERLLPCQLLRHNGPETLMTTVNTSADHTQHMIYCLHYIQQKKAEDLFTIDMVIPLREVKVDYYVGDKQVVSVKDVVTGCALPFKILADGYVQLTVEELRGYCVMSVQTV